MSDSVIVEILPEPTLTVEDSSDTDPTLDVIVLEDQSVEIVETVDSVEVVEVFGEVIIGGGSSSETPGYRHIQPTAALIWRVQHNLGRPIAGVVVRDTYGDQVGQPVLDYSSVPDPNNFVDLKFDFIFFGTADVI